MKINCLKCGHKVELDDAYDDYEGQVKCWICGTLLEIRTKEGRLESVDVWDADAAKAKPVSQKEK
ncbi:MAG: hypothetical protein P9M15_07795 [Candidatus Electryoneaceae bacterium]|nr:hypothetical protein [Candidatus Electryoneaceae bacterium]